MYRAIRDILFRYDAEAVHGFVMHSMQRACALPPIRAVLSSWFDPGPHPVRVFGLDFRNPVGLAAGFDKNAAYLRELDVMGFGHVEIGTVTPLPQAGNEKPRLFRLPEDRALINRMGFNNEGAAAVADLLARWRNDFPSSAMIIGGNIGKNKATPNDEASSDYAKCFLSLYETVDYFVVNVSSPNTPGLRELQERPALERIFAELQHINQGKPRPKPILLKIAPDLTLPQLDVICALAMELGLSGIVATNTTVSREGLHTDPAALRRMGDGGLSGSPLRERSTEVLRHLHRQCGGKIPLIGSGGIFKAGDAREKLDAGASLVQVWTGFVYEGPGIVRKICNGIG